MPSALVDELKTRDSYISGVVPWECVLSCIDRDTCRDAHTSDIIEYIESDRVDRLQYITAEILHSEVKSHTRRSHRDHRCHFSIDSRNSYEVLITHLYRHNIRYRCIGCIICCTECELGTECDLPYLVRSLQYQCSSVLCESCGIRRYRHIVTVC